MDHPIIQSVVDRIIMKGSQIGWQQEGQENAAIADDGSCEGDDTTYEENAQESDQQAGGGKKAGIIKAGIGLMSPDAIDDKDDETKCDDESNEH